MANAEIAAAGIDCVDLERLRHLAKQATPGPWEQKALTAAPNCFKSRIMKDGNTVAVVKTERSDMHRATGWGSAKDIRERDAAYIAAANPQVVLALIGRIEELEANNYGPEILNDPQALTVSYFAGRMAEGRENNAEIDRLNAENARLKVELHDMDTSAAEAQKEYRAEIENLKSRLSGKHVTAFLQMVDKIPIKLQEKLGEYERKISELESEKAIMAKAVASPDAMPALPDGIGGLEKQLDWLASELAKFCSREDCLFCEHSGRQGEYYCEILALGANSPQTWREAARKAVENAMKEKCNE